MPCGAMNISMFSRESSPVLEDKIDDRVFVVTAERLDEAVVMLDRQLQAALHVLAARPEERMADAGVIDEKAAEARLLQIGIGGYRRRSRGKRLFCRTMPSVS